MLKKLTNIIYRNVRIKMAYVCYVKYIVYGRAF